MSGSGFGRRLGAAQRRLCLPSILRGGRRVAVLGVVLALLLGVVLVGGVLAGTPVLSERLPWASWTSVQTVPPPPPVLPQPAVRPALARGPGPTPDGVASVLDPLVAAGGLGNLSASVVDPATGTVLWARDPATALVPGSTVKLLTAAAALLALDHRATFTTTVVAGAEPGTVVLVGGGDPTLSAATDPTETGYPGAARLDDLADQVSATAPVPVQRVLVDVRRYTGDALAPGWADQGVVAGGYVAPIVPVMLDGGRSDPAQAVSPRAALPATAAAAELARRLGVDPGSVGVGTAAPAALRLGQVSSPPVTDLVATLLNTSDNVLAEALAREVARARNADPSFAGASQEILAVLAEHGFTVTSTTLVDGSGLSTQNKVPAALLTELLSVAAAPDASVARTAALRPLLVGLPVAGGSGTLADRYHDASTAGRGWIRAKTGTLIGVNSLAGTVLDADGRILVFALVSNGPDPTAVRARLDALAAALRSCGCR